MRILIPGKGCFDNDGFYEKISSDKTSMLLCGRDFYRNHTGERSFFVSDRGRSLSFWSLYEKCKKILIDDDYIEFNYLEICGTLSQPIRPLVFASSNRIFSKILRIVCVVDENNLLVCVRCSSLKLFAIAQMALFKMLISRPKCLMARLFTNPYVEQFIFEVPRTSKSIMEYIDEESGELIVYKPDLNKPFKNFGLLGLFRSASHNELWHKYCDGFIKFCEEKGRRVKTIIMPLTKIKKAKHQAEFISFIPHCNWFEIKRPSYGRQIYYMQVVLPEICTFSLTGWGRYSSNALISNKKPTSQEKIKRIKLRTKYRQSSSSDYVWTNPKSGLIVLQMPKDQSIKYGFDYNYNAFFVFAAKFGEKNNLPLVCKLHPLLRGKDLKMAKEFCEKYKIQIVNGDIKDMIEFYDFIVTVSSGVGFEAVVADKRVILFGDSEYEDGVSRCFVSVENEEYKLSVCERKYTPSGTFIGNIVERYHVV